MTVTVSINGNKLYEGLLPFTFTQEEFHHEVMRVRIPDVLLGPGRTSVSGTPMSVTWSAAPFAGSFYGYVNHCEPTLTPPWDENVAYVEVVGAGCSFWLKDSSYKTFKSTTVPQMVQAVAADFKLRTDVQAHPYLSTLTQAGQPFWSFLVASSKKIGFTLYPLGAKLVCHDRSLAVAAQRTSVRVLRKDVNMHAFRSYVGAANPSGGDLLVRQTHGVNPRSQQPVYARNNATNKPILTSHAPAPLFSSGRGAAIASDQAEAQVLADGEAANNRLFMEAETEVHGDPQLRPGGLVQVAGVNATDDGFWYVKRAVHEMTQFTYSTRLTLGRDGVAGTPVVRTAPVQEKPPAAPRLVNGRWV